MCGIVGYIGQKLSKQSLVKILKKLEYRGYDSAGLAALEGNEFCVIKSVGNIDALLGKISETDESCSMIAHTRWATHGKVSEENSHPHLSANGEWAVVHNGIIENYLPLKKELLYPPKSSTDTAVVAELIAEQNVKDIAEFIDAFSKIKGSYAIVAAKKSNRKCLFVAKNKSPLYIACGRGGTLVASDPICFVNFSSSYYALDDGEFAEVSENNIKFFNQSKMQIKKSILKLGNDFQNTEKKEYPHFMLKEINETAERLQEQIEVYKEKNVFTNFNEQFLSRFNKVVFVGCGTAYHAGLMGAKFIAKNTNLFSYAEVASEFVYLPSKFIDAKTLCIFVSQSGETADTLQALQIAKSKAATCVALTNVTYSTIARLADIVLPVQAGVEIAVAATKSYVCQLSAIYMLSKHIQNIIQNKHEDFYLDIENLSRKIMNFDTNKLNTLAKQVAASNDVIFIGKELDSISAAEASLKLKEVSYINSASYHSGELKHGFLALVDIGTPLIAIAGSISKPKTLHAVNEAASRGANVIIFSNEKISDILECIYIDEPNDMLFSLRVIVPLQYLAYQVSISKNVNPDQPKNLAKSVTVE